MGLSDSRLRSSIRSAKTGNEPTARGQRDTFSSALRLLLDNYLMFHHEKVSIPPIFFGNAFVERESGMGGMSGISPKSLPYPSHDLSYSQPHLIEIFVQCRETPRQSSFVPILGKICGIVRQQVFPGIAAENGQQSSFRICSTTMRWLVFSS